MTSSLGLLDALLGQDLLMKQVNELPEYFNGLSCDSRKIQKDHAFVVISGHDIDASNFVMDAQQRGASILIQEEESDCAIAQIIVNDARKALAISAKYFYGNKADKMNIVAVTGTNGKTSVAHMYAHLLNSNGVKCGINGTIHQGYGDGLKKSQLTSPSADDLYGFINELYEQGVRHLVLEASSHGLVQSRLFGLRFSTVIFTNLSVDHLDYHGDMENYFAAKKTLFSDYPSQEKIINADDEYGQRLSVEFPSKKYGSGSDLDCSIRGDLLFCDETEIRPKVVGEFNLFNAAAACLAAKSVLGIEQIKKSLESFPGVAGRMELFVKARGGRAFVDFAHGEDSLRRVLCGLRKECEGRLILVFGCGGARDRERRYGMGRAAHLADEVILTNDNPRTENPDVIIRDIQETCPQGAKVILDRAQAIRYGWGRLGKEDVLLVAGKGHETTQIMEDEVLYFSDQEVLKDLIECEKDD